VYCIGCLFVPGAEVVVKSRFFGNAKPEQPPSAACSAVDKPGASDGADSVDTDNSGDAGDGDDDDFEFAHDAIARFKASRKKASASPAAKVTHFKVITAPAEAEASAAPVPVAPPEAADTTTTGSAAKRSTSVETATGRPESRGLVSPPLLGVKSVASRTENNSNGGAKRSETPKCPQAPRM
jgi:hypothetical protein